MSGEERAKHDQHFFSLGPAVTGEQARGFFMKSGLPSQVLAHIWGLADLPKDGKMDKKEFSIASGTSRASPSPPPSLTPSRRTPSPPSLAPGSSDGDGAPVPLRHHPQSVEGTGAWVRRPPEAQTAYQQAGQGVRRQSDRRPRPERPHPVWSPQAVLAQIWISVILLITCVILVV